MNLYLKGIDTISSKQHYDDMYKVQHIGFLAQDVETLADSLNFDFHGIDKPENSKGVYGIRYAEFVPPLVKEMQEQQEIIEQQNNRIQLLENQLNQLSAAVKKLNK